MTIVLIFFPDILSFEEIISFVSPDRVYKPMKNMGSIGSPGSAQMVLMVSLDNGFEFSGCTGKTRKLCMSAYMSARIEEFPCCRIKVHREVPICA